jgi:hypothetical protein
MFCVAVPGESTHSSRRCMSLSYCLSLSYFSLRLVSACVQCVCLICVFLSVPSYAHVLVLCEQGAFTTFALCGFIRQSGGADAALLRMWEKKQGSEGRS